MKSPRKALLRTAAAAVCALAVLGGAAGAARADGAAGEAASTSRVPAKLQHVGVDEHLDGQLPLGTTFKDEAGKPVRLGDFFGQKPVLLIFAYHSCPVLCSMVQNATATSLKQIPWTAGKDFEVVVISIDPRDTPEKAAEKRAGIIGAYGRPGSEKGFHFLVGEKGQIDQAADAAGFKYTYDEQQGQYGHPAVIMLVKPNGQMARYLYGLEYEPNDIRLGLLEASEGRSVGTVEKVLLYCYRYDETQGKYVVMATRVMRIGGGLTVLVLGGFLGTFWMRERRRSKSAKDLMASSKQSSESDARGDHVPAHVKATGIET